MATTADQPEGPTPSRMNPAVRVAIVAACIAAFGVLLSFANNIYIAYNQLPSVKAEYLLADFKWRIRANNIVHSSSFSVDITYFNKGNRPFSLEAVSSYLDPDPQGWSCSRKIGAVAFWPAGNSSLTEFSASPAIVPAGSPLTVHYEFDLGEDTQPPPPPLIGNLCLEITASGINTQRATVEIPLQRIRLRIGELREPGNPAFLPSPDAMDGKPHQLL